MIMWPIFMILVRRHHKVFEKQESSFRRYADVLEKLGLPVQLKFTSIYGEGKGDFSQIEPVVGPKGNNKWIGIAPFAKHKGKIYPIEQQERVVAYFAAMPDVIESDESFGCDSFHGLR